MTSRFATITESDLGCQRERTKNLSEMNQIKKTYYSQFFFFCRSLIIFLSMLLFPQLGNAQNALTALRWPNTVFARALVNAIQRAHKYCIKTN